MKIVQGFVTISQFVNNAPRGLAPFGELTTKARTYSKEKGEYRHASVPGYQLVTFKVLDSVTGLEVELPQTLANEIILVAQSIVAYAANHTRPYDSEDFQNVILGTYQLSISQLQLGPMVSGLAIDLPEFATWKSLTNDNSEIRVWFSDTAFTEQYTGYEITAIPPLALLNDFFLPYAEVVAKLQATSIESIGQSIQAAKQDQPETVVRLLEFYFVNRHDPSQKVKSTWGVLIYGKEGDYVDAIRDAIANHLLTNSNYTQEQWQLILPLVFTRTEMIVVPRWDLRAVENLGDMASLYSSVVNLATCQTFVKNFVNFYNENHVLSNTCMVPYPYKTITLAVVNGINNLDDKKDFKAYYADYLPIPSTSTDFARMSLRSQGLVLFLDDLLLWAEKTNYLSTLPVNFRRVVRNNKLFVAATLDDINFLVAAKFNPEFH